ncbi:MAG: flagellar basal body-associated FliL family protein [Burkholderiaceae bacterium]|nr:flagellar basal body-associated FliL family protein [Burkholderiaceae bacterium]MDP3425579.1 flagellar basal body-associated FliL family protein [Burkholderiaceae bacterium]MDZ4161423.1 flagellar basal body-associated FliL family protein [Burkholderiales bacterium]
MADKPQAAAEPEKPKSKKMLIIIVAVVLLVVLIGGGAAFFLLKKKDTDEEAGGDKPAPAVVHKKPDPKAPPTYLPMDNMVVNLADPGGGRFAQVGITLKLDDAKTADTVKAFMPSIRNAVLLEISKRTSDELLAIEGKESLTRAIIREVSAQLGYEVEDEDADDGKPTKKRRVALPPSPVQAVLFSSFIVQ